MYYQCYSNINECHFFTDEVMVMIKRAEVQQQSYGEDGKKVEGKDVSVGIKPWLSPESGPGLTTPCHRIRPSEEPVLISSSMVSGESWALKQKK